MGVKCRTPFRQSRSTKVRMSLRSEFDFKKEFDIILQCYNVNWLGRNTNRVIVSLLFQKCDERTFGLYITFGVGNI